MGRNAVFTELAQKIQRDVASFEEGWALDPIRSYARQYGVSPTTVRKALAMLAEQGVIVPGQRGQYLRSDCAGWGRHFRKYPVVGLLACTGLPLPDEGYVSYLLRSFLASIQARRVPVCLLPDVRTLAMRLVPGGVTLGPTQIGCSAVVFLFGYHEQRLAELVRHGLVVMTLDHLSSTEGVDSVVVDCEDEAARAVQFLFDQGHRHIAFIGQTRARNPGHWVDGTDPDTLRFQVGVLTTKRRLGLDTSDNYHELCKVDNVSSDAPLRQTLQRLLRLRPAPTALILFDVTLAHQARTLLREWGIHCPSQVSILSRDECNSDGDITRLASDPIHMGNTAAQHLLNRLSNPSYMATRLLFRSTLIEGQTTARAPQTSA
jgi:hypothetical protein